MARPIKQGLEYFSFDVDFFSDIKVRRISRACGPASTSILICLLCNIYRDKGYYILWDENLPFVVADTIGTTEGAVEEVVKKAVQVGFFDKYLFDKYKILTSNGIQNRFKSAVLRREKIDYVDHYLVSSYKNEVIAHENEVIDDRNTQSKVNNKKEEEIITKKKLPKGSKKENLLFSISNSENDEYRRFCKWLLDKAPNCMSERYSIKPPIEEEYMKLRAHISISELTEYVLSVENNNEYLKKYKSMYLTFLKWIKNNGKLKT